jgi:hypothetical protein
MLFRRLFLRSEQWKWLPDPPWQHLKQWQWLSDAPWQNL